MENTILNIIIVIGIMFLAFRMIPRILAGVPFVDPQKVHDTMQKDPDAIMLDVRTPEEFKECHVPESINVNPAQLGDDIEEKRPYMDQKVYVICLTSQRAAMAAKTLKNLGFNNVSVVNGGLKKWRSKNLPVSG